MVDFCNHEWIVKPDGKEEWCKRCGELVFWTEPPDPSKVYLKPMYRTVKPEWAEKAEIGNGTRSCQVKV